MKIEFIDNTPHITPETQNEEDQLFDWFEKNKQYNINAVIDFEYYRVRWLKLQAGNKQTNIYHNLGA